MSEANQDSHGSLPKTKELLLSSTFVAAITALGYLITYIYEWGYAFRFNIPVTLISPSLTTAFAVAMSLFVVIPVIMYGRSSLADITFRISPKWYPAAATASPLLVVCAASLIAFSLISISHILWFGTSVLFVATFIVPIFTQRGTRKYTEKIEAHRKQYLAEHRKWLERNRTFRDFLSNHPQFLVLLGVAVVYGPAIIGFGNAYSQKDFLVLQDAPDTVVLRIYGENMICTTYDNTTRTVLPNLVVHKLTGSTSKVMQWQRIGPLKVQPLEEPKDNPTCSP
jgi:hypothetical protein